MTDRSTPRLITLGRLARQNGLARATLLHYESLGLLRPSARSAAGYRLYDAAALMRVKKIRALREAGLALRQIKTLLGPRQSAESAPAALLERRLLELSGEIERLRGQQHQLARLLANREFRDGSLRATKASWVNMLARAGFDEAGMQRWHEDFEAAQPTEHAAFLKSLGLSASDVARIRRSSRPKR